MAGKEIGVKKYIVRLTAEEREHLSDFIRSGKRSAQLLTKARILLKADVSEAGKGWSDGKIAEALDTSVANVERTRRQLVEEGFEAVLTRKCNPNSAPPRIFDGVAEAKLIALACGPAPAGYARWTLSLLEEKVVELNIVEKASDNTIGRTLEKNILKPHLKQQWVIAPQASAGFVANMEVVLEVYQRPHDPSRPLVCLDEASKQMIVETRAHGEVRERRRQLRHPAYQKPELLATGPNQVWSWDITKLMGPVKWTYFYLYVILDIFSRRVVGWHIADAETAALFQPLFNDAVEKHGVEPGQLTLHADRGGPMKAKATALLLADLGVTKSHSRPYTSNDNPFSESCFKTLKYQPQFPKRFGCIEDAKMFSRHFFDWYNRYHHHAGIGLMTPDQVHYGQAEQVYDARQKIRDRAFETNPERFVRMPPSPPRKPTAAWINPPFKTHEIQA